MGKNLTISKSRFSGRCQIQNLFETWTTIQGFFSEKTTDRNVFCRNSPSFQLFSFHFQTRNLIIAALIPSDIMPEPVVDISDKI